MWSILAACAAVWFFEFYLEAAGGALSLKRFLYVYGAVPAELSEGRGLLSALTSMFLHGGFLHLIGNLWFLWIFGDNVEDALGHGKFVLFYVLTGLFAVAAHVL
ncbi:MAG: rhomboid family intramembrane serine protease, partial [Myxococcales bacterium]|nr:rhomboid family intramembrane serine protease [Myxococcales bacterium]